MCLADRTQNTHAVSHGPAGRGGFGCCKFHHIGLTWADGIFTRVGEAVSKPAPAPNQSAAKPAFKFDDPSSLGSSGSPRSCLLALQQLHQRPQYLVGRRGNTKGLAALHDQAIEKVDLGGFTARQVLRGR